MRTLESPSRRRSGKHVRNPLDQRARHLLLGSAAAGFHAVCGDQMDTLLRSPAHDAGFAGTSFATIQSQALARELCLGVAR